MTTLAFLLAAASLQDPLPERVRPVFREFCADCHADGSKKGGFALDAYRDLAALAADKARWSKAVLLLQSHVMPPANKPQPSPEQRRLLLEWIDGTVFACDPEWPDPGQPVLRRLNREEVNNALRDVLGVRSRPADAFPPDDSGYGFDTIGDVLTLSPALLEKAMAAARQAVDEATLPEAVGQVGIERTGAQVEVFAGDAVREKNHVLLRDGAAEAGVRADVKVSAIYRVLVQAAGVAAGGEIPRLAVLSDGRRLATIAVEGAWKGTGGQFKTAYVLVPLEAGARRVSVRVENPGGEGAELRTVALQAFRLRGPFSPAAAPAPGFLAGLVGPERAAAVPRLALSGEDLEAGEGKTTLDTGSAGYSTNGYRHTPLRILEGGRYRFRVKAGAQQAGDEPVRFELRLDGKRLGPFAVTAAEQRPEWIECEAELEAGTPQLQVWFVNAFRDEARKAERWLWIHEFSIEGPLREGDLVARAEVPGLLETVARRLWRRPLRPEETKRLAELASRSEKAGQPPLGTLRLGLLALLSSPNFLYWAPPVPAGEPSRGSVAVDEFALASRLSAFLWSSVPDETLLRRAEEGTLRASLRAEVDRMLADPKSRALTENFAGQWLELRSMPLATPDAAAFPGWSPALAADLRRESELLFEHALRDDRPFLEIFGADYTFLNARLAAHYGIPGVEGEEFRRVSLAGAPRRGFLTHGSFLTISSHPNRTSPVKRGKFVLEKVLGTPPPPAPKDVPPLPEDTPEVKGLTMRQRFEAHRNNAACASCHAFMDPPGFAFEHFDAIGRYRDRDEGRPVDAAGRLVTGESFQDAGGLIAAIVRDRAEGVAGALAEQLLTYALGRGVEYTDKHAVREIVERSRRAGWRFHETIRAVAESVPFQRMRIPGPK